MIESHSPGLAYLTKVDSSGNSNIGYPGIQSLATADEVAARLELASVAAVTTVTGGAIKLAR